MAVAGANVGSRSKGKAVEDRHGGVGSEAVERATSRSWAGWLGVLDRAGAQRMVHKDIARLLREKHGLSAWWSQMVTVGYEQARGLRQKHEKADGFAVYASKTIAAPVGAAYRAWTDARQRQRWLPDASIEVRKATKDKSLRLTWEPGPRATNLEVDFHPKGEGKCQVSVEHGKLASAAAADRAKRFWSAALGELKALLER